jgi:hypothetical protein
MFVIQVHYNSINVWMFVNIPASAAFKYEEKLIGLVCENPAL